MPGRARSFVSRWRTRPSADSKGSGSSGGHAAELRGRERERRAVLGAGSALGARALTLALSLVTVPLALEHLGPERYGMWFTISSVVALLSFADLGIGYGLLNSLTQSLALGDAVGARRQVSSSVAMLTSLALLMAAGFAATLPFVTWSDVFAVTSPQATAEAAPSIAVFVTIFLVGLPLSVATQVRVARQEVYLVHLVAAVANVVSLVALLAVIVIGGGVPILVAALAAPPMLAVAVNAALLSLRDAPELRPALSLAQSEVAARLMRTGFPFFVLQMATTVAFATDSLVIAQLVGPEAVAEYGVVHRLFTIPIGIVAVAATPLWPAYGDAIARGDVRWARDTFRRSLRIAWVVSVPAAVVLVALGSWIIGIWVGEIVAPPMWLIIGFGLWTIQSSVGHTVAMFLNGANEVRAQAIAAAVMATANVGLSIWLTARIGVSGAIWGTVLTYAMLVLGPMALYVPRVVRHLSARSGERRLGI